MERELALSLFILCSYNSIQACIYLSITINEPSVLSIMLSIFFFLFVFMFFFFWSYNLADDDVLKAGLRLQGQEFNLNEQKNAGPLIEHTHLTTSFGHHMTLALDIRPFIRTTLFWDRISCRPPINGSLL